MANLQEILLDHISSHPEAGVQDAAKLIYQNEFGGGHLISDPEAAFERLRQELDGCSETGAPLWEPIGGGAVRLNLGPASRRLSAGTIFRIFYLSSQEARGSRESFEGKLKLLYGLGFDRSEVDRFLKGFARAGYPMISHTQKYRDAYSPAYRVADWKYVQYIDILSAVDRFSRFAGPIVIGVDGMCAAGKTTLAAVLAEVYDANVFHADDYFLPAGMRTPQRLAEAGGNMHRERLADEVLAPLARGETPVTRRFDCRSMTLGSPVAHSPRRVNIVEGSYCLHPELTDYYTLKIALRVTPKTQLERIKRRCPEDAGIFESKWIPMENAYFEATDLFRRSDMTLDTDT